MGNIPKNSWGKGAGKASMLQLQACPQPSRLRSSTGSGAPHEGIPTGIRSGREKGTLCLLCLIGGRGEGGKLCLPSPQNTPHCRKLLQARGQAGGLNIPRGSGADLGKEGGGSTGTAHTTLKYSSRFCTAHSLCTTHPLTSFSPKPNTSAKFKKDNRIFTHRAAT